MTFSLLANVSGAASAGTLRYPRRRQRTLNLAGDRR